MREGGVSKGGEGAREGGGRSPRVLLVGPKVAPPHRGGIEKGVDLLLRSDLARETGMRAFNNYRPRDPRRPLIEKLAYQIRKIREFGRELKQFPPDLVHVKTSSGINFHQNALYSHTALRKGLPVVLQIHDGRFEAFYEGSFPPLRAWIRCTLHRVSAVAVLSEYWAQRIAGIAHLSRIRVVPNGLEEAEIHNLGEVPAVRSPRILFVGTGEDTTTRDKGLEDLLEVMPALVREHPQASWILAGLADLGEVSERLRQQGTGEALASGRIGVRGLVGSGEKLSLLRESTVLALPSYYENMPNILLEAMAAGMGVVASRVGAVSEMLVEGAGGILIRPGDRAALRDGLARLLTSPALLESQGRWNREALLWRYSMEVVQERLAEIYREVLGRSQAAPQGKDPQPAIPGGTAMHS